MQISKLATLLGAAFLTLGRPGATEQVQLALPTGSDLQAAIDRAKPGDVLVLEAGALFVGNFTLPRTSGSEYITIRSSAMPSRRRPDGRVGPDHISSMPIIRSPNGEPALATKPGAHHWRLQWLAIEGARGGSDDIVRLGDGGPNQRDPAAVPHHFELDGLIIRGDSVSGAKRGIALHSRWTSILNSDIREIKSAGQDSQAICGWNGPGPFLIENNYLEAAGENIMFGGADPVIQNLVPSDITIRRNHFSKPLEWRAEDSRWTVKNLLELKSARRVMIEWNLFEHNWAAAQTGYAILFTPANQDGRAPWTVVSDVMFRFNVVRHVASAINILGYDTRGASLQTRRLQIHNNLFYDVDASRWGGDGRFLLVGDEPADITVDHNTVVQSGSALQLYGKRNGRFRTIEGFRLTNNLMLHNEYGIIGDETGIGRPAVAAYLAREDIRRNVLAGGDASAYPPDNFFPSVGEFFDAFVDRTGDDYRLKPGNRFRTGATDGSILGADVDALTLLGVLLKKAPETAKPRR